MSIIEKALEKMTKGKGAEDPLAGLPETVMEEGSFTREPDGRRHRENTAAGRQEALEQDGAAGNRVVIDLIKLGRLGYLTADCTNQSLIEQFRRIKMPILSTAFRKDTGMERNKNILMVTSAMASEGKTYNAINLSFSITLEYNFTVLFMDVDLTNRSMTKLFGLDDSPGLTEYLISDRSDISKYFYKTNIEKLSVIPSGKTNPRSTELLTSTRMNKLLAELSDRYNDRLIILDTPPLLQDSSSVAISKLANQIAVVVEAEKTPRHLVAEALKQLEEKKEVNIILNKSNQHFGEGYYYYYNVK
jgi:exopolysaccharide/PEP-CTERM locus tyrosine autokinase